MNKLAQLREHRNVVAKKANDLNAQYPADKRMPNEDVEKLDTILAEIEQIDTEIAREKKIIDLASEDPKAQHEVAMNAATRSPGTQSEESKVLRNFLRGGLMALTDQERGRIAARQTPDIRNAMSTTTPAEGGFTVAIEYMREIEKAMKAYGGMREASTVLPMASGAHLNWPTTDPTAEEGEIVGQNVQATNLDTTFDVVTIEVYKYSSKSIAIPFELIQDSFIDIEAYIRELLAMRIGRITNKHFTVGAGFSQPRGIVNSSLAGKVGATGQTATITYDDLVDLEHSVDPAYRSQPGLAYMMHDQSVKILRKVKDADGRPIFVPGYEQGNPGGAPDRLMGHNIIINNHMPEMAASAKSVLYGDLKKYMIRDVMDLTLFRMTDSAFTLKGQVGFVAFMRTGGHLVDRGGAVRHYQNSAT
jgi:HK97 family phage major capsid protein